MSMFRLLTIFLHGNIIHWVLFATRKDSKKTARYKRVLVVTENLVIPPMIWMQRNLLVRVECSL